MMRHVMLLYCISINSQGSNVFQTIIEYCLSCSLMSNTESQLLRQQLYKKAIVREYQKAIIRHYPET